MDLDQTPRSAGSDLGLCCLHRSVRLYAYSEYGKCCRQRYLDLCNLQVIFDNFKDFSLFSFFLCFK